MADDSRLYGRHYIFTVPRDPRYDSYTADTVVDHTRDDVRYRVTAIDKERGTITLVQEERVSGLWYLRHNKPAPMVVVVEPKENPTLGNPEWGEVCP